VAHHRARTIAVELPPGTEVNVDGEIRAGGLDRVTVRGDAYTLIAG
jgi:hypothetical protein